VLQRGPYPLPGVNHFGDLPIGGLEHPPGRGPHVVAGLAAAVPHAEESGDLAEREAKTLRVADQREPIDDALTVLAVAGPGSDRLRDQPDPLVISNRVAGFSRTGGDFANRQKCGHRAMINAA
jgi:hypothetical protein